MVDILFTVFVNVWLESLPCLFVDTWLCVVEVRCEGGDFFKGFEWNMYAILGGVGPVKILKGWGGLGGVKGALFRSPSSATSQKICFFIS